MANSSSISLSQVYQAHHYNAYHIIPLNFDTVRELPETHAWPPLDKDNDVSLSSFSSSGDGHDHQVKVPVIDLSSDDAREMVGRGCETWGTFQVINHGVPLKVLESMESQCRLLFSLPTHEKMKALRPPDGASGYGLPRISCFHSKLMWIEGFTIMGGSSSLLQLAPKLFPHNYTTFCEVVEEYNEEMRKLAERLLPLMMDSLGIPTDRLPWHWPTPTTTTTETNSTTYTALQLNSYPPCPDPNRAMGIAPHTDTSLFTILQQTQPSTGLQVLRDGVGWAPVPPVSEALVVNIGDLFHILSNGRFPSALHRAVVDRTHHRYSVGYFYGPPIDINIFPLLDPPRYRSSRGWWQGSRFGQWRGGGAVDLYRERSCGSGQSLGGEAVYDDPSSYKLVSARNHWTGVAGAAPEAAIFDDPSYPRCVLRTRSPVVAYTIDLTTVS
ncbi:hypothetical protein Sjap_019098 [Stephania japonica]|uniref:Fe2OG dioxygenase domain-containing protein n=1 Tax=Stephania japonica TaxID=461633 RepID=A0AAP0F719_9MAGN